MDALSYRYTRLRGASRSRDRASLVTNSGYSGHELPLPQRERKLSGTFTIDG